MPHRINSFLLILTFALYGYAVGIFLSSAVNLTKAFGAAPTTLYVFEKGTGRVQLAKELQARGIISDWIGFTALTLIEKEKPLKAGEYEFSNRLSAIDVLKKIQKGDIYKRSITFPEGFTNQEMIDRINANNALSGDITSVPPEGYLMPETYFFTKNTQRQKIIDQMVDRMNHILDLEWAMRSDNLPLKSKEQALTLASIIEKETGISGERAKVAGVFINRLRIAMKLQSDPTVIYAITKGQEKFTRPLYTKDLQQTDSPYNTYLYEGLPPAPIANPGIASIHAALHPENHAYLYFVADGTSGHVFAKTLDEHNNNVEKWRALNKTSDKD